MIENIKNIRERFYLGRWALVMVFVALPLTILLSITFLISKVGELFVALYEWANGPSKVYDACFRWITKPKTQNLSR